MIHRVNTMNDEVLLKLSLARQYVHHANFAGTPRQAIADAYSAVDSVLSALLLHEGIDPPFNHKTKFDLARKKYPNAFESEHIKRKNGSSFSPGADWRSLEVFYKDWLASRYESFTMKTMPASNRVGEAASVISAAVRFLAKKEGTDPHELETRISQLAFGYDFSEVSMAVGKAHDHLFYEAEIAGEMYGSKLGVKLAATTNYCALDIIAGDELTQSILKEDKEIAIEAAMIYRKFIELVDRIDSKRLEHISGGKRGKEWTRGDNEAPDFMLAMKARYHGGTVDDMGNRWGKALGTIFSMIGAKEGGE
jgi:hypothetical protein